MKIHQTDNRLLEVEFLRPLAVLLVVVLHSFTVYWGKWSPPEGFVDVAPYRWIAATSFSFTMELFVMLSGYVFGYQLLVQKRDFTLKSLMKNKFRRLIVPSLVFGILYASIFYWNRDFFNAAYSVLNGAGHLWFLPMLFWCFVLGFLMYRVQLKERYKLLMLLLAVSLSLVHFPLRLDRAFYYLFFFYSGIFLMKRQDLCGRFCADRRLLPALLAVYLVAFISYELVVSESAYAVSVWFRLLKTYWTFVYASAGVAFFFLLTYMFMRKRTSVSSGLLFCSSVSFGVYLFHQIILEVIYYKTSLPVVLGPYLLPWVGFAISLSGSVLLVLLVRRFYKI